MDTSGISDLAETIIFEVGAWEDFGYPGQPPDFTTQPGQNPIPPLGSRSADAIKAGHTAVDDIDKLTRQLYELRAQLVSELRQDADIRGARVDALLAKKGNEK